MRILLVEDQLDLVRHVRRALERANHVVSVAADGPEAVELAMQNRFDLIILDLNLPGFSGLEVMKKVSPMNARPRVLMLTARSEVDDRVRGLNSGADDYLTKPFDMKELLARIEALGRRVIPGVDSDILEANGIVLDVLNRKAKYQGDQVELSPREFSLLQIFMREPGRTFSRGELFERVWGRELSYEAKTVEIFIGRLRKKLDVGGKASVIETVRGIGYKLNF